MEHLTDLLATNPYFSAGFGLVGVGAAITIARRGFLSGLVLARRWLFVSLEIPSRDKSYQWFLSWMSKHQPRTPVVSVQTHMYKLANGRATADFALVPGPGRHWMYYRNRLIAVERTREKQTVDLQTGSVFETIQLTTIGTNKQVFYDLLAEAKEAALAEQEGKTIIYSSFGHEWRPFGLPRRRRPLHSVVLREGISERLLDDVREFQRSRQWYIDTGIPYRRGYLLHGPPGCGKSSFIAALAGELDYNICILSLSDKSLTDDRLNHLLCVAPQHSIILLEDIDAIGISRAQSGMSDADAAAAAAAAPSPSSGEPPITASSMAAAASHGARSSAYQAFSHLTFSGLLNALDGVASSEERIMFMTTNFLDRLDPALVRPGRVDIIEKLDYASDGQLRRMFMRFYPDQPESRAEEFQRQLSGKHISMAHLQGFLMLHKKDPIGAIENAHLAGNQALLAVARPTPAPSASLASSPSSPSSQPAAAASATS